MNFKDSLEDPVFQMLKETVEETGLKAWLIGGYVRDLLLERPCKDIDIVVEGKGLTVAEAFARKTRSKNVAFYENFGTAMVMFGEYQVEFVGARKESYQRHSRKPVVEEGTLEDDQLRRDFTINALSISLNHDDFGELFDPFHGLGDLQKGIIKTPTDPDITFSDDPLRMMRAIRFATQLDFYIDEVTYAALQKNKERIDIVSKERITDELNKIIQADVPSKGFKLLFNTELLHRIFPDMVNLQGVEYINGYGHKDNFYHTLQVLDNICKMTNDLWLRWSAVLHDIAKPATKRYYPKQGWSFHGHEELGARWVPRIFKQLRLPQDAKMKFVQKMVRLHLRPIALVDEIVTDSAIRRLIIDAGEDLESLMILCRADITTRNPKKMSRILANFDEVERKIVEVEERDQLRNFQPPLSGEKIMEMFHLKPSRIIGMIKNEVKDAILEGIIENNEEAAENYARKIFEELKANENK